MTLIASMFFYSSATLLIQFNLVKALDADISIQKNTENKLDFIGFAAKAGYAAEGYDIITEDGYILKLFHIPGDKSRPIFLMHGLLDSADTYILRENTSLAITLANENYDVWAGNYRGNKYSRRHLTLDPDTDKSFWDYSFHEIAVYDITAVLDFILNKTGQEQLSAVGHSEGTTCFYALGAIKPKYNAKIKVMISLAPVGYLTNAKGAASSVLSVAPVTNAVLESLGFEELLADNSAIVKVAEAVCKNNTPGYLLCNTLAFSVYGYDPEQIEPEFLENIFQYFPAGSSRKNAAHIAQLSSKKKFRQYDYGLIGNNKAYNSSSPPAYDLSKVTMKVALIVGKNDNIAVIKDVKRLQSELPNVVKYFEVESDLFNHIDFVWGRDSHKTLYPFIVELVRKYD